MLMLVNITDVDCVDKASATVSFKVSKANSIVTLHTANGSYLLYPNADGYYRISVENAEYAFVTVD